MPGLSFFGQKNDLKIADRDNDRKTAINAMHYSLEEVYFKANNAYPRTINPDNLRSLDPELFKDPYGRNISDPASDYRYEPSGCEGDSCKRYILRADLEHESDFVKNSRN